MRRLQADDAGLWRRVTRGVAPLPRRAAKPLESDPPDRGLPVRIAGEMPAVRAPVSQRRPAPPRPQPPPPLDRFAGVDRATAERLKRGRYPVEARLDLHGMTQERARAVLESFLVNAWSDGWRAVLVITGKGVQGDGILKRRTPEWLAAPHLAHIVAGISDAARHHGGEGALYVALKRKPRS
jgi:DNA-nicking Smr family endonuclease